MLIGRKLRTLKKDNPETYASIFKDSKEFQFKGRGEKVRDLITFEGMIELTIALTGKVAQEVKMRFVNVIKRYFAGDPTMINEIVDNNLSNNDLNQAAREDAGVVQFGSRIEGEETRDLMLTAKFEECQKMCLTLKTSLDTLQEQNAQNRDAIAALLQRELRLEEQVQTLPVVIKSEYRNQRRLELSSKRSEDRRVKERAEQEFRHKNDLMEKQMSMQAQAHEQDMKRLDKEKENMDYEVQMMEKKLEIHQKMSEHGRAQYVDPCTIDRVSDAFNLLVDILNMETKSNILKMAGRLARDENHGLLPLPGKIMSMDGKYEVYQYAPERTPKIVDLIKYAKVEELKKNQRRTNIQYTTGNRDISEMFGKKK